MTPVADSQTKTVLFFRDMLSTSISAKTLWASLSKTALIIELFVSYALAVGIWIAVCYVGAGADSYYVVVAIYIAVWNLCFWATVYAVVLLYLRHSRKLSLTEMTFLSMNPRKDELSNGKVKPYWENFFCGRFTGSINGKMKSFLSQIEKLFKLISPMGSLSFFEQYPSGSLSD